MKVYVNCIFLLLTLLGTKCNQGYERAEYLYKYMDEIQAVDLQKADYLLIHQTAFCNSCTEELIDFIDNMVRNSSATFYVLLSDARKDYIDRYKDLENTTILIDKDFAMERYGLAISYDMFFSFNNGKISDWSYIKDEHIEKLGSM